MPPRVSLLAFAGYFLLALPFTWPLPLHPASAVPGLAEFAGKPISCDTWTQLWSLWWTGHAAAQPGESLFFTRHLFHPGGTTLALHTLFPLYGLLAMPLAAAGGLAFAWNALLWILLAASGWAAFRFCHAWTRETGASLVAGAAVAFSAYTAAHLAAGHLDLVGTLWLPLYLWAFLPLAGWRPAAGGPAAAVPGGWRRGALAGLLLACAAYAALYYVAFLLLLSALALGARIALRRRAAALDLGGLLALGAVSAACAAPLALAMAEAMRGPPFLPVRGHGAAAADVASYLLPSFRHLLWGPSLSPWIGRMTGLPQEWTLAPGLVLAALSCRGWRAWRDRPAARLFAWGALLCFVLSLGIYLKLFGRSEFSLGGHTLRVPLPCLLTSQVPGLANLRSTGRFGFAALLLLAPLAAAGGGELWRRWAPRPRARRLLLAGLLVLLAIDLLPRPAPLLSARVPALYERIAADPGEGPVLEVPFGMRDGSWTIGREEGRFLLYQTRHGKPLFGGVVSRMRQETARYPGAQPVLQSLIRLETAGELPAEEAERDRRLGRAWFLERNVRFVLVHEGAWLGGEADSRPPPAAELAKRRAILAYLESVLQPVEISRDEAGITLLRLF